MLASPEPAVVVKALQALHQHMQKCGQIAADLSIQRTPCDTLSLSPLVEMWGNMMTITLEGPTLSSPSSSLSEIS